MNTIQRIHQTGGKVDYGTPLEIVDAAREVMDGIDLDVASAPYWNRQIKARRYYHVNRSTRWYQPPRVDPLRVPWTVDGTVDGRPARVWMNHPYGYRENWDWVSKLVQEFEAGRVLEAICLTWAEQSTAWGKLLRRFPRWFPEKRIAHLDPETMEPVSGGPKGSMATYLGPKFARFAEVFERRLGGGTDYPSSLIFGQRRISYGVPDRYGIVIAPGAFKTDAAAGTVEWIHDGGLK